MSEPTLDQQIAVYIQLRDWIKEQDEKHKARCAPAKQEMARIEGVVSKFLADNKMKNGGASTGTFYKSEKPSATIGDKAAFRRFIFNVGEEWWDLIDLRANAGVVENFIKEHKGEPPPGVNFTTTETIHILRPQKKS